MADARCRACGGPEPAMRERSKPENVFCNAHCQRDFYAEALTIGGGIFEGVLSGDITLSDKGVLGIYRYFRSALADAFQAQATPPTLEQRIAYLARQLHEMVGLRMKKLVTQERMEQEGRVFDAFLSTVNAAAVLTEFGISQQRLARFLYYEGLRKGSMPLVEKLTTTYGVDAFGPRHQTDTANDVFDWILNERYMPWLNLASAIEHRVRTSRVAAYLTDRPDFVQCLWESPLLPAPQLDLAKQNVVLLLSEWEGNVQRVQRLLAPNPNPAIAVPTPATSGLSHALWSGNGDMVRLMFRYGWVRADLFLGAYENILIQPETPWTMESLEILGAERPNTLLEDDTWANLAALRLPELSEPVHRFIIARLEMTWTPLYYYMSARCPNWIVDALMEHPLRPLTVDEVKRAVAHLVRTHGSRGFEQQLQHLATSPRLANEGYIMLIKAGLWAAFDLYFPGARGVVADEFFRLLGQLSTAHAMAVCWADTRSVDTQERQLAICMVAATREFERRAAEVLFSQATTPALGDETRVALELFEEATAPVHGDKMPRLLIQMAELIIEEIVFTATPGQNPSYVLLRAFLYRHTPNVHQWEWTAMRNRLQNDWRFMKTELERLPISSAFVILDEYQRFAPAQGDSDDDDDDRGGKKGRIIAKISGQSPIDLK
jgi:hypothetical protein